MPRNRYKDLKARMDINPRLMAPLPRVARAASSRSRSATRNCWRPPVALKDVAEAPIYSRWNRRAVDARPINAERYLNGEVLPLEEARIPVWIAVIFGEASTR